MMKISQAGISLIKKYEGCRLEAYLCPANIWTIGYGHTGNDVYRGLTVTQPVAEKMLVDDLARFETIVTGVGLALNQNQFDALVGFTYNCGKGNLQTLIRNRTLPQIADALPLYNKGGGKVLAGLVKRRAEERTLFLSPVANSGQNGTSNPYPAPTTTLRRGAKSDTVKWLQHRLCQCGISVAVDGVFGEKTEKAVEEFQEVNGLTVDGIVGPVTRVALKSR